MVGKDAVASYIMLSASLAYQELPRAGGPVRVGLCKKVMRRAKEKYCEC